MGFLDTIEVKQNLIITVRERGKIVDRREGHNIWVNLGREYLAKLIAYSLMAPLTPETDHRIRYMGVGIGGDRQLALGTANAAPLVTAYPGTNVQTDSDLAVTSLERPVRISGGASAYPGVGTDVWVGQVGAPAAHPLATQTKFVRTFTSGEVNYGTFLTVPLSEIGLFTNEVTTPGAYQPPLVAYDTFDTISKTAAFELEIDWTIRF
jgi:hypothetical protein